MQRYLNETCTQAYQIFFDDSKFETVNSMEKVCDNDCFLTYKYTHEFVTDYDFDEIIFPRKFTTDDLSSFDAGTSRGTFNCTTARSNFDTNDYNLYTYVQRLKEEYGQNVGCFRFEHVLFIDNFDRGWIDNVLENYGPQWTFEYRYQNNSIFFSKDNGHLAYMRKAQRLSMIVKCLNESMSDRGRLDVLWNNLYAYMVNTRDGKSIYDTNLVELINQHEVELLTNDAVKVHVDLEFGFSGHFREFIKDFFTFKTFPLTYFRFDIEYYYFITNLYN